MKPFVFEHTVRTFETNSDGKLTPSHLLNLLQYGAGKHAEVLGWSVRSLHESGQTWVLQRFCVEILTFPSDGDTITITTYPSGSSRILAYRDYKAEDQNGNLLVKATSGWVILDLASRNVVPVPEEVSSISERFGPRIMPFPSTRQSGFNPDEETGSSRKTTFSVRKHDLDLNRHVNNVRYMEWAMESVPEEIFDKQQLRRFDIVFKAECFYGDVVSAYSIPSQGDGHDFRHMLIRDSDKKPVCLMESSWTR